MNPDLERAEALIGLHRADEALVFARAAMAHDPGDPEPHLVASRAHVAAKDFPGAEAAARRVLALDPQNSMAMRLLAIAVSGTGDVEQARVWATEAVGLAPDDSRAHGLLAHFESLVGAHRRAIARAEEAVRLDPHDSFAHRMLGSALLRDGRHLAAEQALRQSLALDPQDAQTLSALGRTLAARGRPEGAAELLQLAARADIRDAGIHQDMLRYVRGGAGGLATWPIIVVLCVLVYPIPLAIALYVARRRRIGRFPPEVRRLLNRQSRKRATFESGGPAGLRPWWWRILVRIPLAPRALVSGLVWLAWLAVGVFGDVPWNDGDWTFVLAVGAIPCFLTGRWFIARRKAIEPHRLYAPGDGELARGGRA